MARHENDDRINQPTNSFRSQVDELKKNVSILHLCSNYGIELTRHGMHDYKGVCPFHDDEEPSFIVTPARNLFHCMGCDAGGSVIDLVMLKESITLPQAIDKLIACNGLVRRGVDRKKEKPKLPEEKFQQFVDRCVNIYEKNFSDSDQCKTYLEGRGITDAGLYTKHRLGYSDGLLKKILPESSTAGKSSTADKSGGVREQLKEIGILHDNDIEHYAGCLVVPVLDVEGNITTVYGRGIGESKRHVYLAGRPTGLWNVGVIKTYSEIILTESIIDALSVEMAGYSNVVSIQNTNGINQKTVELFKEYGVEKIILLLDGDKPGREASKRLKEKLSSFSCEVKTLPDEEDPNSYLQKHGAESLQQFIKEKGPESDPSGTRDTGEVDQGRILDDNTVPSASPCDVSSLTVKYGLRSYRIMGLEKGPRKLKATLRIEHGGKLHVDTIDFYSARSRRTLAQDLCRIFEEVPETIESDVTRLLQHLEKVQWKPENGNLKAEVPTLSAGEKKEAEKFGNDPDLIKNILRDFEICGLVGEEHNKLLSYLAVTSRKRQDPLALLVLSCSGAGKTALQDAACDFCPPEDLVKLTSLSGKALFYKDQLSLKHKVLALEEGDGAQEASYAIRNLISAGVLVSESTIKDLSTGRLTTMQNTVEGPSTVLMTTTNPQTDPETKSRFWITSVDESREQTRKILAFQRELHKTEGAPVNQSKEKTLRIHRNFQRLLKPVAVNNPFAGQLTYGDDRLQGRRDQPKYLNLIKAVAFLRQMQKPWNNDSIEVDLEDVRIANELAHEVLGKSLDELSGPSRNLLLHLDELVEARAGQMTKEFTTGGSDGNPEHKINRTSLSFSRRDIREYTGWTNYRVHTHMKELVEFEYVVLESGRNGTICRYRLAYEGQGKDGERFVLGLKSVEELLK